MAVAEVSPLLLLLILACPIGMGLMMLFMMFMGRGMGAGSRHVGEDRGESGDRSLPDLKAEQARISERIEALEKSAEEPREPTEAR